MELREAAEIFRARGLSPAEAQRAALALQEAEKHHKLKCPKCGYVGSAKGKCAKCGHDLSEARKAKFAKLNEAKFRLGRGATIDFDLPSPSRPDFNERLHPRDRKGRFRDKPGGANLSEPRKGAPKPDEGYTRRPLTVADLDDPVFGMANRGTPISYSNTGPEGKPRNVKRMGEPKLRKLYFSPLTDPELKNRVEDELIERGLLSKEDLDRARPPRSTPAPPSAPASAPPKPTAGALGDALDRAKPEDDTPSRDIGAFKVSPSSLDIDRKQAIVNAVHDVFQSGGGGKTMHWKGPELRNMDREDMTFITRQALPAIGNYNSFDPRWVAEVLEELEDDWNGLQIAREYSPALYIRPTTHEGEARLRAALGRTATDRDNWRKADEADERGDFLRLWWD